jgi:hypothetical protein
VIIDPMTNEIICKVPDADDSGKKVVKVKDSWFVLNFKLKWNNPPEVSVEEGSGSSSPEAAPITSQPAPSPVKAPAPQKKISKPRMKGGDD